MQKVPWINRSSETHAAEGDQSAPGRARSNRKHHRVRNAGQSPCVSEVLCASSCGVPHQRIGPGCIGHPAFRAPSFQRGRQECSHLGRLRAARTGSHGFRKCFSNVTWLFDMLRSDARTEVPPPSSGEAAQWGGPGWGLSPRDVERGERPHPSLALTKLRFVKLVPPSPFASLRGGRRKSATRRHGSPRRCSDTSVVPHSRNRNRAGFPCRFVSPPLPLCRWPRPSLPRHLMPRNAGGTSRDSSRPCRRKRPLPECRRR